MAKSSYKPPYVERRIFRKAIKYGNSNSPSHSVRVEKVISRSSFIYPIFVGRDFLVHNGKGFIRLNVREEMIEHKFGEFASTKKRPKKKITKLRKKNKK